MGCWNSTCGITQLPIQAGDKIRLFVLNSVEYGDKSGGGTCYPHELWEPIGLPIAGEYNDYGGIENIVDAPQNEWMLQLIKKYWVPFTKEYEEVPKLSKMTLEEALYFIERDYAKSNKHKGSAFGQMLVLEDVYQAVIKYDPIRMNYHDNLYRSLSEYILKETENTYRHNQLIASVKRSGQANLLNDDNFFFDSFGSAKNFSSVVKYMEKPLTDVKVKLLLKDAVDFELFQSALSSARKMWIPQTGQGSQESNFEIHQILIDVTQKIINDRHADEDCYYSASQLTFTDYMLEHNMKQAKINAEKK